jgi:hypothetical protein
MSTSGAQKSYLALKRIQHDDSGLRVLGFDAGDDVTNNQYDMIHSLACIPKLAQKT